MGSLLLPVDTINRPTMSAMSCRVMTNSGVLKDENGLILPRKIANPCMESMSVRQVHKEIKWNKSKGINVLPTKSELEKVLAKQRKASEQKSPEHKNEVEDEFKKVLSGRARRLEKLAHEESLAVEEHAQRNPGESKDKRGLKAVPSDRGESVIQNDSEFAKVFAQLRGEKMEMVG